MAEVRDKATAFVEVKIENLGDFWNAERGELEQSQIRSVVIPDADISTAPFGFGLPPSLIELLGLTKFPRAAAEMPAGSGRFVHHPIRLTILNRSCSVDVIELPEGTPARIGNICLGNLDLVIDRETRTVVGNPAHGGEQIFELY